MDKKIIKIVAACAFVVSTSLTSCANDVSSSEPLNSSTPVHEHTYSSSYEHDDTYHWHPSTCGHDVISDKEKHTFVEKIIEPTYEKGGFTLYTCSICGYSYSDNETDATPITITWKNYDGSILEVDENVPYGSTPSYDGSTPVKEDDATHTYQFLGWTPSITSAIEDKTYTATYSSDEILYSIDFDLNGGISASYVGPIEVNSLNKDYFFFDCVKDNYVFRGWEYQGEKIFDENGRLLKNITLLDGMTFKAIYSETANLTVISNIENAGEITGAGEYQCNSSVPISVTPYQGYKFIGWYYEDVLLSNNANYSILLPEKDIVLEARFENDEFTMRIYSNSEEHGEVLIKSDDNLDYKAEYEEQIKYQTTLTIEAKSKTDVRFLGWYDENNKLISTDAVYTFDMPNHDYALEAKWNYFTITYDTNGGVNDENNPDHYCVEDGVINLQPAKKEGYPFIYWVLDNEKIVPGNAFESNMLCDIVLSAYFSPYKLEIKQESDSNKYLSIVDFTLDKTNIKFFSFDNFSIPSYMIIDGERLPVKEIGQMAFMGSKELINITIPSNVVKIGSTAFGNCSNLKSVKFEENSELTSIGSWAFSQCVSLNSIVIPKSVSLIEMGAFDSCDDLTVFAEASTKPIGWGDNSYIDQYPIVWGYKENDVVFETNADGFRYTTNLDDNGERYVIILQYIGEETNIVIPDYIDVDGISCPVKKINNKAFKNNPSINSITISNNITVLEERAFYGCQNLQTIIIEQNSHLDSIESYAFSRCSQLQSIYIPSSVTKIGEYAFDSLAPECQIYCGALSQPEGWDENWNSNNYQVTWGATNPVSK